jgi:AAA15 family ATPase/GTPase
VSRVFALALHLAVARGGFLFLDEIENGLHWSVMPSVWRFLVETARSLDVQVFATTHSKDCLEALADLNRTYPELAEQVSVQRLEAGRETSVRFDAGRIAENLEMDLEAR